MEHMIIGIDLGHCESAMAFPRCMDANSNRHEVRRLVGKNKDQVVATQIILSNEQMRMLSGKLRPTYADLCKLGDIQIGNKLPTYVPDGEKFCYFKAPPKEFDKNYGNTKAAKEYNITHGQVMACFIYALINDIFKYNREDLRGAQRENIVLFIGCPTTSDWTGKKQRNEYSELVRRATNVKDVRIIPESRAAMFSSIENEKNQISAVKGVIVFDFGSSTADCTYMLLGRKIIEFSWSLGAYEIERQMTLAAYEDVIKDKESFDLEMTSFADAEDNLRTAKEEYYGHRFGPNGHPMICTFVNQGTSDSVNTIVNIDDKFMNYVVNERLIHVLCDSKTSKSGTWGSLCRDFFRETKKMIEESTYVKKGADGKLHNIKCEIDTIVLTGGASGMDFIYDLCKEIFGEVDIEKEDNPSHTVSNGLGWVAVTDSNFETCLEDAKTEVKERKECSIETLCSGISDSLFDRISEIVKEKADEWAEKPGDNLTVRDLQNSIESCMNDSGIRKELLGVCEKEINVWKDKLSSAIEIAVNNQVKRLYAESVSKALILPDDIWSQLHSGALSLDYVDTFNIIKGVNLDGMIESIIKEVTTIVIWLAALALAYASLGLSIIVAYFLNKKIRKKPLTDADLDKTFEKTRRREIADNIKQELFVEKKEDAMKDFNEDLKCQMEGFDDKLDEMLRTAFEIVTLRRFNL